MALCVYQLMEAEGGRGRGGGVMYLCMCESIHYSSRVVVRPHHRVHTEWQRPLSGVHSIMMEKLSLAGERVGCTPPPLSLYLPSRTKLQCTWYAQAERAVTLPPPISSLPPMSSVVYIITHLAWLMYLARWGQTFSDQQDSRQTAGS
jgi:hypothetical protein